MPVASGPKLDEEIEIAARRVVIIAGRRTEKITPPHMETALAKEQD